MLDHKKFNRRRRIWYILYLLLSIVILLVLAYRLLDDMTIIMYAPEGWTDSEEVMVRQFYRAISDRMIVLSCFILFVLFQTLLATIVFFGTKRKAA